MIRDATLLPPYKDQFNPDQFEMEAKIQHFLQNNTTADEDIARILAASLLKMVLGHFRPDMFEDKR